GQILASKLLVVLFSTAAMLGVLWPAAIFLSGHQWPEAGMLSGRLGLWLVGALEAIAWGMLFSLLGARPLVAVILAIVAPTTCPHLLSRFFLVNINESFELASFGMSALWRALLAALVLGVDVYLGLQWLGGGAFSRSKSKTGRLSVLLGRGQGGGSSLPPNSP